MNSNKEDLDYAVICVTGFVAIRHATTYLNRVILTVPYKSQKMANFNRFENLTSMLSDSFYSKSKHADKIVSSLHLNIRHSIYVFEIFRGLTKSTIKFAICQLFSGKHVFE